MMEGLTLKEKHTVEDQWHTWHKPEEASEMKVAAVAQWQGQQHLQRALVSAVVAEPHHADLMLLEAPTRRGTMVTVERRDDIPEHTTVTEGVVDVAVVVEA